MALRNEKQIGTKQFSETIFDINYVQISKYKIENDCQNRVRYIHHDRKGVSKKTVGSDDVLVDTRQNILLKTALVV